MNTQTFTCSHCGAIHPLDERILCGNDALCPDCADLLTVHCDRCGDRIYLSDVICDERTTLCQHCYSSYYTTCEDCGRIISEHETYYADDDEDRALCEHCFNAHQKACAIHEYSYHPEPIFYGEGRYFGVELEIDDGGQSSFNAKKLLHTANQNAEHLYIKTDGSLDHGLELVTHPMTLEYHHHVMPWDEVLKQALDLGYLSHRTSTCGLHIHISRTAFGDTEQAQELAIARLLYFVEKFWSELLRFSRRTERQMNRWAARYGFQLSPQDVLQSAKDSRAGRYTAVNLTNSDTVEIRMFRGTLKLNTLIATLQMVHAMCDVALFLSDEELQALSWHGFLERIHEPELIQYLKERSLYRNDPVECEEDA